MIVLPIALASAFGAIEAAPSVHIESAGQIVVECADERPELCAVELEQGDLAPFAGQLLTPALALALGQAADSCDARMKLLLDRQALLLKLAHERELAAARPRFWERPSFVAAATATSFVLVLLAFSRVP